jgi:isopentenyl-diphosphate delta-isomerase
MTEYFDWVDRTDRIIGVTAREEAHRLKLYHRAVHLYARGSSGGLLLQKRSSRKDMEPGLWTLSCSGHVDRGETYLFAAIREMVEELNVSIEESSINELLRSDPTPENGYEFIRSYEVLTPIEPVPNPEEIAELKEIGLEELDSWMIREPQVFSSSFRHLFPMARKRFLKIR